jgi:regulator of sirC expression with transglutaminase-like and TPR domain
LNLTDQETKVKAMVSLLGDRSLRVRNRVSYQLESQLPAIEPELKKLLQTEEDPLIRERLTILMELGKTEDPVLHWKTLQDNMALNLRDGMVAISLLDEGISYSRLELLEIINQLCDDWLDSLSEKMTDSEKVNSLMTFLFASGRFKGNSEDYYSLNNCFFHRMVHEKAGLPVTLCLLAVMMAEEADLPLYGIGLPLHFIVGHFQGSEGIRFFDCFDEGREVTPEECVNYLHSRGIFFHPQLLSPCDSESILQRVLINIKHIAQRKGFQNHLQSVERLSDLQDLGSD